MHKTRIKIAYQSRLRLRMYLNTFQVKLISQSQLATMVLLGDIWNLEFATLHQIVSLVTR